MLFIFIIIIRESQHIRLEIVIIYNNMCTVYRWTLSERGLAIILL